MFGIITQVFSDNANHVRPDPLYQEILISNCSTVSASGIVGAISRPTPTTPTVEPIENPDNPESEIMQ